ncbi:MAG: hypothetical protein M3N47_02200, partial [Chloroflexota bacterium]|nr:hypothetical protein [Chloroflexota bacterium]
MSPPTSPAEQVVFNLTAGVWRPSARISTYCTQGAPTSANKGQDRRWVPASADGWYTEGPRPDNGVDDRSAVGHNEQEVTVGAGER